MGGPCKIIKEKQKGESQSYQLSANSFENKHQKKKLRLTNKSGTPRFCPNLPPWCPVDKQGVKNTGKLILLTPV